MQPLVIAVHGPVFSPSVRHHNDVAYRSRISRASAPSVFSTTSPRRCCLYYFDRRRFSSLRSSARRRCSILGRLSRSRVVGVRLPRPRPSSAALVYTRACCVTCLSRLRLGMCLGHHRPSLASPISTMPLQNVCVSLSRLRGASVCFPRAVGLPSLRSSPRRRWLRFSRGCISVCALVTVGLCSLRSSARRRCRTLAHLSRPRVVGVCFPRRRPSLASLVAVTARLAYRAYRGGVSSCALVTVGLRSLCSSPRWCCRTFARLLHSCLPLRSSS